MAQQIKKKFLGNDQVDGDKISLLHGQAIRIQDALGTTESDLIKLGASGEVLVGASGYEVADKAALTQEIADRIAGDSGLDSRLTTAEGEINTLQFDLDAAELAIANEITRATGVESGLDSRLTTAEGEINTLQFDLDAAELAIANEITRATGVEAGLDSRLTTAENEINTLQFDLDAAELAISNEVTRATGIEAGLDSRLTTAESEINTLQFDLDAAELAISNEVTRATGIEAGLDSRLTTAENEIDTLQFEMDAVESTLLVKADLVGGLVPANQLPSYVDDVLEYADFAAFPVTGESGKIYVAIDTVKCYRWSGSAYVQITSGAVDSVNGQNGIVVLDAADIQMVSEAVSVESKLVSLQGEIDAEETARASADSALQGEIDAEEIARAAADVTLQNNIDAEETARINADNALDTRVDALEAVAWFKESFAISNNQTSVTLTHAPIANSVSAFVDRLAIHQGDDYTISTTTMTFIGDLVNPGQSELAAGDTVYVKYQYSVV